MKALVIDDHQLVVHGIAGVLEKFFDSYEQFSETTSVLTAVREHQPEFLILDAEMDGKFTSTFISDIRLIVPEVKILIFSSYSAPSVINRFMKCRVDGYIHKSAKLSEIERGISAVLAGKRFMDEVTTSRFMEILQAPIDPLSDLTEKEFNIFKLLADDLSYEQIAQEANISVNTIGTYKSRISTKLGLSSRKQLRELAVLNGLLKK